MIGRTIAWGFMIATAAAAGGCGYTTQSQYPSGVKTVAVPMFQRGRDVYRRELEMALTEAVIKRLELDTPYKVIGRSAADTELTGTIDRVEQRVLSMNPDTGLPRELEITMSVSLVWKDLRTGKELLRRSNLRQAGVYIPPQPLGEDFFQGSQDVVNQLAKRIVEQLESPW